MPDIWSVFDFFSKRRQQKALRDEDDKRLFIEKYRAFRDLLKSNNDVLQTMGDMQEKAGGAFVFDRAYIESSYEAVSTGVKRIIDLLNVLCDGEYGDLVLPYQRADKEVRDRLFARFQIPETDFVLPLRELGRGSVAAAGGKFAQLGELANSLAMPVPPGFVVTTRAYREFLTHNQIRETVKERTAKLDVRDFDALQAASLTMQELIRGGEVPGDRRLGPPGERPARARKPVAR